MTVRDELIEATSLKPAKKEAPEAFRQRLIEAVDELEDADYKALSKSAKAWVKDAVAKFNEDGTVPDFSDDDDAAAEDDSEDDDDTASDEDSSDEADADESDTDEDETEDEAVTTAQTESASSRRKAAAKSTAKKAKVKARAAEEDEDEDEAPPKKAKAAKGKNSGTVKTGGLHHARKLLAADPAMEVADLAKSVKKAGFNVSSHTLSTTASGFRAAVKALQEEGLLKRKLI